MLFSRRRTESIDKERILLTLASEFPQLEFSDKDQVTFIQLCYRYKANTWALH